MRKILHLVKHKFKKAYCSIDGTSLFKSVRDKMLYIYCNYARRGTDSVNLALKDPQWPVIVRPGTTDAAVLRETWLGLYHVPDLPLPEDPIILDLGTNVGYTAVDFLLRYPGSSVVCVELDEANVNCARRNLAAFPEKRYLLIHAGIWIHDGFVHYEGTEEWSYRIIREQSSKRVRSITLDSLIDQNQLDFVDYVKMDIEGAELEVLAAGGEWTNKVRIIKVEVHPPATIETCMSSLESWGFLVRKDLQHPRCVLGVRKVT